MVGQGGQLWPDSAFLLAGSLDFKFNWLLLFALINSLLHEKQDGRPDAYRSDKREPYMRQLQVLTILVIRQHRDCTAVTFSLRMK